MPAKGETSSSNYFTLSVPDARAASPVSRALKTGLSSRWSTAQRYPAARHSQPSAIFCQQFLLRLYWFVAVPCCLHLRQRVAKNYYHCLTASIVYGRVFRDELLWGEALPKKLFAGGNYGTTTCEELFQEHK